MKNISHQSLVGLNPYTLIALEKNIFYNFYENEFCSVNLKFIFFYIVSILFESSIEYVLKSSLLLCEIRYQKSVCMESNVLKKLQLS